jgi:hypothetical protein
MAEEILPALTAAQWESVQRSDARRTTLERELLSALLGGAPVPGIPEPRHALAALLLDRRPFGFTRHDLLDFVGVAQIAKREAPELYTRLESFGRRLSALLPPV